MTTERGRIEREIAGCERRLRILESKHAEFTQLGFLAVELAGDQEELSRQYVGMVSHYHQCVEQEKELLAGLRMERKAEEDTHVSHPPIGQAETSEGKSTDQNGPA